MSRTGYINVSLELFGGLLSLFFILSLCITRPRREKPEQFYIRLLICNTCLLFCDAAAWLFKGRIGPFSSYLVHIANFLVFTLGYVMLVLFTRYLTCFLQTLDPSVSKRPLHFMQGMTIAAVGLVVLSQYNHMYYLIDEGNVYHRQSLFWLSQAIGLAGMVVNCGLLLRHRKLLRRSDLINFGCYISLPVVALLFQIFFYNIAVLYLATTICLICIYISIQLELSHQIDQKELELERSRTAMMLSQIQPHFLCNALIGIKELCDTNPQRASDALEHFSYYLRGNLDSLSGAGLIPFSKELEHVRDYLFLEQMRFSDRFQITWEIGFRDFLLPPLTLQPIVENAVRHGILPSQTGCRLTIRCEATAQSVVITVEDDGVGFEIGHPAADGRSHTGIENVRGRLERLCGGSLELSSAPGAGTSAVLRLPRQDF